MRHGENQLLFAGYGCKQPGTLHTWVHVHFVTCAGNKRKHTIACRCETALFRTRLNRTVCQDSTWHAPAPPTHGDIRQPSEHQSSTSPRLLSLSHGLWVSSCHPYLTILAKEICKPGRQRTVSWVLGYPLLKILTGLAFLWSSQPLPVHRKREHLGVWGRA